MKKTAFNNAKQHRNGKLLGGITGKGFSPGQSGNPSGRAPSKGLINSLKVKIGEVGPDGRTVEDLLVEALIQEAFVGKNRMAALAYVFDRLEGRPRQEVDVKNITEELRTRTDDELQHFLVHGAWPPESRDGQETESKPNGTE
jgi:hypothetical protein